EVAVVEDEDGRAGPGQLLGEGREPVVAGEGEAVGHHDTRPRARARRPRLVDPGGAGPLPGRECEVAPFTHARPPSKCPAGGRERSQGRPGAARTTRPTAVGRRRADKSSGLGGADCRPEQEKPRWGRKRT